MEETLQQEKQESEYKNPNEDQGGIRRRLRDRDLLRKRKAEAEEKETNQWVFGVESQRKRQRAEDSSGAKKKGRPRKTEPKPEVSAIQQEAAPPQEGPAVVVVPEPTEVILDQTASSLSPLLAVESKPASVLAAPTPLPLFGSIRTPVFAPTLTPPAPALFSPSVPAQAPAKDLDTAPDAAPVTTSDPAAAPSAAPPQVDPFYIGLQGSKALDQVLIEDLGPDEEQDTPVPQDKRADEDLSGTALINVPEQNKMFSVPTFPQPPPPQEYFPGNSF